MQAPPMLCSPMHLPAPPLSNVQRPASHCVRSIGSSGPVVSTAGWGGDGGGGLPWHQPLASALGKMRYTFPYASLCLPMRLHMDIASWTSVSCLRWCDAKASAKPCMISRCEVVYQYFFRAGHGCCRRAPSSAARVQVIKQSAPDVMMYQWLAIKAGLFR